MIEEAANQDLCDVADRGYGRHADGNGNRYSAPMAPDCNGDGWGMYYRIHFGSKPRPHKPFPAFINPNHVDVESAIVNTLARDALAFPAYPAPE